MNGFFSRILGTLKNIYLRHPRYIALNAAAAVAYYLLFTFLIRYQNYGIFLLSVPWYLVYAMIFTASMLLTISVYSVRNTRRNRAEFTASTASAATLVIAGVLGGCGCSESLVFGLAALGISSSSLFSADAILVSVSVQISAALLAVNVLILLYYLNKLSKPSCAIRQGRKR